MALSTYAELRAAVADTLNRDDLAGAIPDFIRLMTAEASSKLRVRQMVCRSTATIDGEYAALPPNFCGVKAVSLLTSPVTPLAFVDAAELRAMKAQDGAAGRPRYYTVFGSPGAAAASGEVQFLPAPDGEYVVEFLVYEAIPDLATYETNWLLDRYPHVCLYGALKQSAPYLKDDERLPMWAQLFEDGLAAARAADAFEVSGHRPTQRTRRFG